jgi:sulfatase maturation enzyme AslB (radical SAM superfamily)
VPANAKDLLDLLPYLEASSLATIGEANRKSPTTFCEKTTDFGITAILAHLRHLLSGWLLWHLEICPTAACPIECSFCSYTERNQEGSSIPWPTLQRLIEDAKALKTMGVYFSGGGDPLAYKEIAQAMELAAEFSGVSVQTNAVLLDRLLKMGCSWFNKTIDLISWSVYAHDAKSFERACRAKANVFHRIETNVRSAVNFRDTWNETYAEDDTALPATHLSAKIVVHRDNHLQLPEMVAYARSLRPDTLHIRLVDNFEPGQNVALSETQLVALKSSIKAATDPVLVSLHNSLSHRAARAPHCQPYTIEEGHIAIVETDGSLYLSIPSDGHPLYRVGNLNDASLRALWGSPAHHEVIHKLRSFLAPLTQDRHHKNDVAIHDFVHGDRRIGCSADMLSDRNFRLAQRAQL